MSFIPLGLGDVAVSLSLMAAVVLLSLRHKLGLEKDLVVGTLRAFVQLLIVGHVLRLVFSVKHPLPVIAMLLVMMGIAVYNGVRRQSVRFQGMTIAMSVSIALVTSAILAIVVAVVIKAKPWFQPQVVIPIAGMTVAASMNAATLAMNRFSSDLKLRKKEVETALALGASPRVAIQSLLKDAAKAAMIPSINSLMIVGVVQLPGMMSGQILSGIDPIQAINYQIVVVYMICAAGAFTSYAILLQSYRRFFTAREQLRPRLFLKE